MSLIVPEIEQVSESAFFIPEIEVLCLVYMDDVP